MKKGITINNKNVSKILKDAIKTLEELPKKEIENLMKKLNKINIDDIIEQHNDPIRRKKEEIKKRREERQKKKIKDWGL